MAPGAVIYGDTTLGRDCVIGSGTIIGGVGLAYHDRADGRRSFFPHLAGVRIGNRVDIGAASCICRGMLSHTRIGDDAKIGSLVYVSHGGVIARERGFRPERQLQDMRRSPPAHCSASAASSSTTSPSART